MIEKDLEGLLILILMLIADFSIFLISLNLNKKEEKDDQNTT